MRIVGGDLRGRVLEAPAGRDTRPTSDRAREAIASMVLSACGLDLSDVSVLDAFAGSGGVGLELISRGARHCTFCERNRRSADAVRRNCRALGLAPDVWRLYTADVYRVIENAPDGAPYGVVFLDPPYALDVSEVARLLEQANERGLLSKGCVVVYERAAKSAALEVPAFERLRTKSHGIAAIDTLRLL